MFPSDKNIIKVVQCIHPQPQKAQIVKWSLLIEALTSALHSFLSNQVVQWTAWKVRNGFPARLPNSRLLPLCSGKDRKHQRKENKKKGIAKVRERRGMQQMVEFVGEQPSSILTARHKIQQTSAVNLAKGLYFNCLRRPTQFTVRFNWNCRQKELRN